MLNEIVETKKKQLEDIDQQGEIDKIKDKIDDLPPTVSLKNSLIKDNSISIIAEIKRCSPSKGILAENLQVDKMTKIYQQAGASAISVLTEELYFNGSIDDLKTVKQNTTLPVLRKDFILEEYQIWESRSIGADAILLIVGLLAPAKLSHYSLLAEHLGLDVLFEVHNEYELEGLMLVSPQIVGINNRDLKTFEVNLKTAETLAANIPTDVIRVGESGIHNRDDIIRMENTCLDAVLIGEGIITAVDPAKKIMELLGK
ncbi:MAG: indole-3-glycerol phosphate synthase TrpC [candidate division Zixibacteria bacterium]|nr:indole-3-glycerol phosphate synthase TrpC [candidate division Zixibacteria bacterium]